VGAKNDARFLAALFAIGFVGWTLIGAWALHSYRSGRFTRRAAKWIDAGAARQARTPALLDPAPVPVPTSLPLVGGDATLPDGYPVAYVDGAAFRSLLFASRFDDLNRYFVQLQDAFEADNKREYWTQDAASAFGSSDAKLAPRLDGWVAASPDAFAPYLARGAYWNAVGWKHRGSASSKDTPAQDKAAMRVAHERALEDLDKALALRPALVSARVLRLRVLLGLNATREQLRTEVDAATKTCPGCFRARVTYLLGTTPRWGGSYADMHAYAATCDPAKNARCRLLDGFVDYDLADLAWIDHRLADAEADIDRAIALGDCTAFFVERSHIRRARKDSYEGALADADRALGLWHNTEALVARADALSALKRWEPAGHALLEAIRVDPTDARAAYIASYEIRGLLFQASTDAKAGRRDDALRALDLAADLAPTDREVLSQRSQILGGVDSPNVDAK